MKLKLTTTTNPSVRGRIEKRFFLNGIHIATHQIGTELYCEVKNGHRSNLRVKPKKTNFFMWERNTLRDILGDKFSAPDFRIDCPDLHWGYTGGYHTATSIKALLTNIFSR